MKEEPIRDVLQVLVVETLKLVGPGRKLNQEEGPSIVVSILVELEHLALELLDERLVFVIIILNIASLLILRRSLLLLLDEMDNVDPISFLSENTDIKVLRVSITIGLGAEDLNDVTVKSHVLFELLINHVVEGEYVTVRHEDVGVEEHKALEDLTVSLDPLIEDILDEIIVNSASIIDGHSRLVLVGDALDESASAFALPIRIVLFNKDLIVRDLDIFSERLLT